MKGLTSNKIILDVDFENIAHTNGYLIRCRCEISMASEEKRRERKEAKLKAEEKQRQEEQEKLGLVGNLKKNYEKVIEAFIRPPRSKYAVDELGVPRFLLNEHKCRRDDFVISNNFGQRLQCSWFDRDDMEEVKPCVVYCHANSGCRLNALKVVRALLPFGCSVLSFDFSGSGLSEGDYVTLGSREHKDIECVVRYVRAKKRATSIALWGRSMGAVSSLLYGNADPDITAIVADSPFSDLPLLCEQLVASQNKDPSSPATAKTASRLPSFIVRGALYVISSSIEQRCDLNIFDVSPIKLVPSMEIPIVFLHGTSDTMVNVSHSQALYDAYGGQDKRLILCEQGHNSARPPDVMEEIIKFLGDRLQGTKLDTKLVRKSLTEDELEPESPRWDPDIIDTKYF